MDVLMPQLGETVAVGKITTWFRSVGDEINPGDNLFEIETDKVTMEVPATSAGVLRAIHVVAGEVAPVGAIAAVSGDGRGGGGDPPALAGKAPPRMPPAPLPAAIATPTRAIQLDPFREVRTPVRNFGPARLASGTVVTP